MARNSRDQDDRDLGWGDTDPDALVKAPPPGAAAKAHCANMGIDPETVSEAIRQLSRKFKRGPLEVLWQVVDDENASKSARHAAACAILPYLQGKPAPMKAVDPKAMASGVMEVPVAESMEQWMGVAGPSQAALKAAVRE